MRFEATPLLLLLLITTGALCLLYPSQTYSVLAGLTRGAVDLVAWAAGGASDFAARLLG